MDSPPKMVKLHCVKSTGIILLISIYDSEECYASFGISSTLNLTLPQKCELNSNQPPEFACEYILQKRGKLFTVDSPIEEAYSIHRQESY